jgi:hypothetical protein
MDAGQVQPITVRTGDVPTQVWTRSPASNTKSLAAMHTWSLFSHQLGSERPEAARPAPPLHGRKVTAIAADSECPDLPMCARMMSLPGILLA